MDYYNNQNTVNEYIQMAEGHDGRNLFEHFKKHLKANSTILELGSGPGTDWKILSEDYLVTGSDNSEEFLERLRTNAPNGEFIYLDAVTIETDRRFDAIYSNKVLHHLGDEALRQSIERQAELLRTGGLVCHSFWLGEGTEEFKGMFVNYHTIEELNVYFEDHFEVLNFKKYAEFDTDDSVLLIARCK